MAGTKRVAVEPQPFLKWAGGKAKMLRHFAALFPRKFRAYHEPFLGAGAVFFHLRRTLGEEFPASLTDANADLVLTFQVVRDRTDSLLRALARLQAAHSDREFYVARDRFNGSELDPIERAAHVIYLNKTGFNGLYRVNSKGEFNVPLGRYVEPRILEEPLLRLAAACLQGVDLDVCDFERVRKRAKKGDFVYFDPPYDPLTRTAKFTSYAQGGFGEAEQKRLADCFAALDELGVQVMLSNHDTPLVRRLFKKSKYDYRVVARVGRAINSDASRRSVGVSEVVVRNYE